MFSSARLCLRKTLSTLSIAAVVALFALRAPLSAAPLDKVNGSLALVPEDAAFYSSMMRNKEQIDLIAGSKTWAELKALPSVQMGLMLAGMQLQQPDSPGAQVKQFFDQPENKQLLDVLIDLVSDEIFSYGGADFEKLGDLMMQMNGARQYGALFSAALKKEDDSDAQAKAVLTIALENLDKIVVPEVVIGFRLTDQEAAAEQLARLEALAPVLLIDQPELAERLKKVKVGETEYLTFEVDEKLIPWDELTEEEAPVDKEDLEKLIAHLKTLKMSISLGIRGDYLLLSFGPSNEHLEDLGQGKTLASRVELAKLEAFADRRLTGIGYVSERLMSSIVAQQQDIAEFKRIAEEFLPEAGLEADLEERLKNDVKDLIDQIGSYVGKAGASLDFSFITPRGLESYRYDWTEKPLIDASKRLTLLDHVGGTPLVAVVARAKSSPNDYPLLRDTFVKAYGYAKEIALPQLEEDDRKRFEQVMEKALPLLKRLDKATGEMFVPALADGQTGFVLDSKLTSRQWIKALPATAEPMPILEPALLFGVSDAELLVKAMGEYRGIINDAVAMIAEVSEGEIPAGFQLPAPEVREFPVGKVYYYRLPETAGIDKRLAPNAGVNDEVAVLSIAPRHSVRLLTKTPISSAGPLGQAQSELAAASYCDIAGLVDVVTPWVELGIRVAMTQQEDIRRRRDFVADEQAPIEEPGLGDPANDTPEVKQIIEQVRGGIRFLKVFRSYSSVTYLEDKAMVTRGELRIIDLE